MKAPIWLACGAQPASVIMTVIVAIAMTIFLNFTFTPNIWVSSALVSGMCEYYDKN
jgi:hypothetical protein